MLVYFSDRTWQKSSMYPGTPPVFAMHARKNILRLPMCYFVTDVLVCRLIYKRSSYLLFYNFFLYL